MGLSRPLTDRHETCTNVWCGVTFENFYSVRLKNLAGKHKILLTAVNRKHITSNMAQNIDRQITDLLSTINALQNSAQIGGTIPRGFDAT